MLLKAVISNDYGWNMIITIRTGAFGRCRFPHREMVVAMDSPHYDFSTLEKRKAHTVV
jgi:hypothetical protein